MKSTTRMVNGFRYRLTWLALGLGVGLAQAQFTWKTTHTTNNGFNQGTASVVRNEVRVTVHNNYLDVEEDLEIATQGVVTAGNDAATLEIECNLNLSPEATLVGGLLWNGNTLLGAKLLSRAKADSLYEQQVERNSTPPPRPRDPMLLEAMGSGNYRLRVYPVAIGETRRLRLRYHIPPAVGVKGVFLPLQTFLTGKMSQITIHLVGSEGVTKTTITQSTGTRSLDLPRSLIISGEASAPLYDDQAVPLGHGSALFVIQPGEIVGQTISRTSFKAGGMAGNYMHLHSLIPATALTKAKSIQRNAGQNSELTPIITATVRNGKHAYDLQAACAGNPLVCTPVVFHGKSDSPWDTSVVWTVYDAQGQTAATYKQTPKLFDSVEDTAIAVLWAGSTAPFSENRENPLGPIYGYVDSWASLLALEKDILDSSAQVLLATNGVPRIANQSIQSVLPNYNPATSPLPTPNPNPGPGVVVGIHKSQPTISFAARPWTRINQTDIAIHFPTDLQNTEIISARILTMDGKVQLNRVLTRNASGKFQMSCASLKMGTYLLRIQIGDRVMTSTLIWN